MTRYALQGTVSRDLLTWNGKVLVHDNPGEMAFLFAGTSASSSARATSRPNRRWRSASTPNSPPSPGH